MAARGHFVVDKNPTMIKFIQFLAESLSARRHRRKFRQWTDEDQRRADFYSQFVGARDLVFDVGANLGNRAKVFHRMGAAVVAIEPQDRCSDFLASVFHRSPNFYLVRAALGAKAEIGEMYISTAHTVSSLSRRWVEAVQQTGRFGSECWTERQRTEIQTLDSLIERFGQPVFIKIDVEGFEDEVLAGLSRPVAGLSFEFTPEYLESTLRCIDQLCLLGEPEFQLSYGESLEFVLPQWIRGHAIKQRLAEAPAEVFGDVYARFNLSGQL